MTCKARTVSYSQLYGGKIAAALSRQHPRDLFDCKYMEMASFHDVKNGFMLCLLGSDKPVIESLQPNAIDQTEALETSSRECPIPPSRMRIMKRQGVTLFNR